MQQSIYLSRKAYITRGSFASRIAEAASLASRLMAPNSGRPERSCSSRNELDLLCLISFCINSE